MTTEQNDNAELTANVSEIVSAYVGKNTIRPEEVPAFIASVRDALRGGGGASVDQAVAEPEVFKPAVSIKRSITPEAIISLIDGKPYKSLKRHLTTHNLTPELYRQRYGLPADYPMVSENYSKQRAALAKQTGLGQRKNSDA